MVGVRNYKYSGGSNAAESPSADKLDVMVIYLVVSLLFVFSTMVELTFVVFLRRVTEWKRNHIKSSMIVNNISKQICFESEMTYSDLIDLVSFAVYFMSYILFNCIYWGIYL